MLNCFILASLYQLYTCQILYQPLVANNAILDKAIESELHLVLNSCEESLQSENRESRELSRNAEQLTNQMETTKMALMALQQQYNVTDSNVVEICKIHPTLILTNPYKCQQYYNCSMLEDSVLTSKFCFPRWHLTECIYPDLFSAETLKCENFTTVTCGSRQEHKWLCDYTRSRVTCGPHRGPTCADYNPKCIGDPDGIQEDNFRGHPFYKICFKDRVIELGKCPYNDSWKTQSFLYNGQCIPAYEIPENEHQYGRLPSCVGKSDGSYQYADAGHKCDAYFTCNNGTARGIKCPGVQLFDIDVGSCREGANCV